jgi:hypothetical protein
MPSTLIISLKLLRQFAWLSSFIEISSVEGIVCSFAESTGSCEESNTQLKTPRRARMKRSAVIA